MSQCVTLSLTLPLSCQICLGKVRKPKICSNNHVFCGTCIDIWLQKCSQCPTCRVSVTPENPCREIIGATNDSEINESHSVKKRLREARGELLLREYEDEIETLLKENEDLKSKNLNLETQLKLALEPSTLLTSPAETRAVDPALLEESTNKLRAANELYQKVKQDVEKLKEANKTLRSQNVDLIQENMRLKAEVESRSPQKFGRYTVAALEAKILQQEREMSQLKKALERSDKYIEDLEAQVCKEGLKTGEDPDSKGESSGESQAGAGGADGGPEDVGGGAKGASSSRIVSMRRSLSEMEEASVCTDLDRKSVNLPNSHGFLLTTSDQRCELIGFSGEALSPEKVQERFQNLLPSTPSSAFSSLSLKSPAVRSETKTNFKRLSYLRRLSFDDCSSSSASTSSNPASKVTQSDPNATFGSLNPNQDLPWSSWNNANAAKPLNAEASEASMDLAYLHKISELDSMMAEGESSQQASSDPLTQPGSTQKAQNTSTLKDDVAESSGESGKRKCSVSLATASPSKLSKTK